MPEEGSIKTAQDGVTLVSEIIKAAGDSSEVREAAGNLGKTAVTLTKTINNALLPLAAINFAFDKAREYFASKFQLDIAERAATIPIDCIIEPRASVAGPALQGLAFTHDEPNLKEMYLSLLATTMDRRVAEEAHPAFVEIIKQLNSTEANLIGDILRTSGPISIIKIHAVFSNNQGYNVLLRHVLNIKNTITQQAAETPRLAAMIDNWIRLGLVEVAYDNFLTDSNAYSWVEQRPEYIRLHRKMTNENQKVEFVKGCIERTELGKQFAKAVGILK